MPRRAAIVFALAAVAGLAVVLWRASADERSIAFRVGALPRGPAAVLSPGAQVCQTPIDVQAAADAVSLPVGTSGRPGAPLTVSVRDLRGRLLTSGGIRGGYADGSFDTATFHRVRAGQTVSLCVRNDGGHPVYPLGEDVVLDSGTVQGGRKSTVDISLAFMRAHPRSVLDLVPTMFQRAAVFRFGWLGAWAFWLLAAAALMGAPLLCAHALARAARQDDASASGGSPEPERPPTSAA